MFKITKNGLLKCNKIVNVTLDTILHRIDHFLGPLIFGHKISGVFGHFGCSWRKNFKKSNIRLETNQCLFDLFFCYFGVATKPEKINEREKKLFWCAQFFWSSQNLFWHFSKLFFALCWYCCADSFFSHQIILGRFVMLLSDCSFHVLQNA